MILGPLPVSCAAVDTLPHRLQVVIIGRHIAASRQSHVGHVQGRRCDYRRPLLQDNKVPELALYLQGLWPNVGG